MSETERDQHTLKYTVEEVIQIFSSNKLAMLIKKYSKYALNFFFFDKRTDEASSLLALLNRLHITYKINT